MSRYCLLIVCTELVSSEYTLKDKRVMCLLRSIGEIIKAFEIATRQFEEEGKIIVDHEPSICISTILILNLTI